MDRIQTTRRYCSYGRHGRHSVEVLPHGVPIKMGHSEFLAPSRECLKGSKGLAERKKDTRCLGFEFFASNISDVGLIEIHLLSIIFYWYLTVIDFWFDICQLPLL